MTKRLAVYFRESFIPITLVIVFMFIIVLYVEYRAISGAGKITVIEIEQHQAMLKLDDNFNDAVSEIDSLISTNRINDPVYVESQKLIHEGRFSDAEKLYKTTLSERQTSETFNDLGVLYYKMGEKVLALAQLNQAIDSQPVYASAFFNRGVVRSSNGDYEGAISDYEKILTHVSGHFEAQYNIGVSYLRLKDFSRAVVAFDKASQLAGGERKSKALYNLGVALRAVGGKDDQAKKAFDRAIRIKPGYLDARIAIVSLYPDDEISHKKALNEIDKILRLKPSYSRAYFQKGLILSAQNNKLAAEEAYRKAIQYNPEYAKARYNLALLMLSDKRWRMAQEQLEWVLKRNPAHVRSIFNLGRSAYGQKEYDRAIHYYHDAAYHLGDNYPEAFLNIGLSYAAKKDYAKAEEAYKKALDIREEYPEAWYNLGLSFMRQGNDDEAIKSFESALSYSERYYQAWFNIGIIYARQNNVDRSIDAYETAILIQPKYQTARLNLAIQYGRSGQYEKAINLYKNIVDDDPDYSKAWFNLGLAYSKTSQHRMSEMSFLRLLELDPTDARSLRHLAKSLLNQNKVDEGIVMLKHAIDSDPSNARLYRDLARAMTRGGYEEEAQEAMRKSRRLANKS